MPESRWIIGAMSGTSGDGVDVALVKINGRGLQMSASLHVSHFEKYAQNVRGQFFAMREGGAIRLNDLANFGRDVSLHYATAINTLLHIANIPASQITAVAAHGQTLFHDPPNTIQWLDPALLAAQTGCDVISDFRRADCAAGGQGAPLVPFADFILFRDANKNRVLLNLGGIANITFLKAGGSPNDIIAFDTGPANCVIDFLARRANLPDGIDRDGAHSADGLADDALARAALQNWPLANSPPPKSTDGPAMIAAFLAAIGDAKISLEDQLATACRMSAIGIANALQHLPQAPDEIIISGGGAKNRRLVREIESLTKISLRTSDEFGVPSESKEAIAFALLGAATLDRIPGNIPSATGAKRAVVLGSITSKPS